MTKRLKWRLYSEVPDLALYKRSAVLNNFKSDAALLLLVWKRSVMFNPFVNVFPCYCPSLVIKRNGIGEIVHVNSEKIFSWRVL